MQVVMPLFQFQYYPSEGGEIIFSDGCLSLQRHQHREELVKCDIFSESDRNHIRETHWALVAESDVSATFKLNASMLLMAFRLLAKDNKLSPIIAYRLSENFDYCSRFRSLESHILLPGYRYQVYFVRGDPGLSVKDPDIASVPIWEVDPLYEKLLAAENVSARIKNALFFVYRAFNSSHWTDAFSNYMQTLEALFSLDSKGPATKTICRRSAALVEDAINWSERSIADLYDIRSRIAHGRLEAGRRSDENLELLGKMERLVKLCLRRLLDDDAFPNFADGSREQFMKSLDQKAITP